jgi:hypothetical protein
LPVSGPTAAVLALYVAVIVLPGMAVVRLTGARWRDPIVVLGVAVGMGLALQPLAYLWLTVARVRADARFWWLALAASVALLAVEARKDTRARLRAAAGELAWPHLALLGILVAVLASRWWAARGLTVPLWGDSLHHTMIVRLLRHFAAVPDSWQPVAPLSTFTYHFGMHAGVATLSAMASLPEYRALLVAGQALSCLQVLTAYALAAGLTKRPWAGVAGALAAAGLSPMPAYYVNWGRYTQLGGQVLLPVACLAAALAVQRLSRGTGALAALLAAGLALTHYVVLCFFMLFVAAWWVVGAGVGQERPSRRVSLVRIWAVAAGAVALVVPWIPRMLGSVIGRTAQQMVLGGLPDPGVYGVVAPSAVWGSVRSLSAYVGLALLVAAGVAAAYAALRRQRVALAALAWTALLVLGAYPSAFGLPVTSPIKDFTVAIGLYVPLGLLLGAAVGEAMAGIHTPRGRRAVPALALASVALAAVLAVKDGAVVNPANVLVTAADERAMTWIRGHTPPGAVFLAGCVQAFSGTVCAGDDAGWWIPLLADRGTTVPPITYSIERTEDPDFLNRTNHLAELWRADLDSSETRAALQAAGVTYAYVGVTDQALPRDRLAESPWWTPVYSADGVSVYAFEPRGPGS